MLIINHINIHEMGRIFLIIEYPQRIWGKNTNKSLEIQVLDRYFFSIEGEFLCKIVHKESLAIPRCTIPASLNLILQISRY